MFSKLFSKKSSASEKKKFFPQNRIEALLMRAANDPGARPEFYKELLTADLYALILPEHRQNGRFVAQAGEHLSIKGITVDGRRLIPLFTSELRLREYIQSRDHLAKLEGHALFSMVAAQGDGVVLNPASSYGKEFTGSEISALVDGTMFNAGRQFIAKETRILIGAPRDYPSKAVSALSSFFQGKLEVKKAYVAQVHMPDSGEPPHLIFAIQADGNFDRIVSDLSVIFRDTLEAGQFADLMQLGQGSLDDYFKDQTPFFSDSFVNNNIFDPIF